MTTGKQSIARSPRLDQIRDRVGKTPLRIVETYSTPQVKIYAKLEWEQLGGSVKARPALEMLQASVQNKPFTDGQRFLEATSGNTGIAMALIARTAGYPITIVLPKNASDKRIDLLRRAGAEIVFSSPLEGTDGAQEMARSLYESDPETYRYLDQYNNAANYEAHFKYTGPEIWEQTHGKVTHFITGLGTSGTFRGVTTYLKLKNESIQTTALQPDTPMHGLEGWKHMETAKVPGIYNEKIADHNDTISSEEALFYVRELYQKERLWVSPSSAANIAGAVRLAGSLDQGVIVTVLPDDGSKYVDIFNPLAR
jgi:S-sulfo-L-cysteine synthase (O-acetyl-L-serine-dependent)